MEIKDLINAAIEVVLIGGMIFVSAYAIKSSNNSLQAVQDMNNKVNMMFLKANDG